MLVCDSFILLENFFYTFFSPQALEAVNTRLRELYPESEELFDIVLVTYNHAHVGVRLINTINYHSKYIADLFITCIHTSHLHVHQY